MASVDPPAPLTPPTPADKTPADKSSSSNSNSSSSNADSDPFSDHNVNFALVVSDNFDPSSSSASASATHSSPDSPKKKDGSGSSPEGTSATHSTPEEGQSQASTAPVTDTESEGNLFGFMASRSHSYIEAYYRDQDPPPPPSSYRPPQSPSPDDVPRHLEAVNHALAAPALLARTTSRRSRPTHRPRFSIGSRPPSPDPSDRQSTIFSPNYSMSTDTSADRNTSATSMSSLGHRDPFMDNPPSPKTRIVGFQPNVAGSSNRGAPFRNASVDDDLPCIVGEFSPVNAKFGEDVHAPDPSTQRTPRRAPPAPSPNLTPVAVPTFFRPGANAPPHHGSPTKNPRPIPSSDRLALDPNSSPERIKATLRAIPKTTTVTLYVDQEGMRDQCHMLKYMRIHKPVVFQELEMDTLKNAANWGESPGKPQPFQQTGCIEFGVDPKKRPKWMFHYSALEVWPTLSRVTVNDDKDLDYTSRKSSLCVKEAGVYSVIGSEAGGKAEWKFTYLVQPRLSINTGEPIKGERYVVPMAFYVSPTFFNRNHATKIGLFSHLKKTVVPKHFAEKDIPPRLSSPVVSSASDTGSSASSTLAKTLGEFARVVGFGKSTVDLPSSSNAPAQSSQSSLSGEPAQPEARRERGRSIFSRGRLTADPPPAFGSSSVGRRGRPQTSDGVNPFRIPGVNPFTSFRTRGRYRALTESTPPSSVSHNWRLNPEVGPPVPPKERGPVASSSLGSGSRTLAARSRPDIDELGWIWNRHPTVSSSTSPTRETSLGQQHDQARRLHRLDEEAQEAAPRPGTRGARRAQGPQGHGTHGTQMPHGTQGTPAQGSTHRVPVPPERLQYALPPALLAPSAYPIVGRNRRRANSNPSGGW